MKEKQNQKKAKKGKRSQNEQGITLIVLIITIVLLLILATVSIRAIVGEDSLIQNTETAAQDYNISQYQEQIRQVVLEEIVKKANQGEEATLLTIGEAIKETEGIIEVQTNISQTDTEDDILAVTKEGYVFQTYYHSTYGKIEIEYLGRNKNKKLEAIPKLTANYQNGNIICTPSITEGSIIKLELIHQGKIIDTKTNISRRNHIQNR